VRAAKYNNFERKESGGSNRLFPCALLFYDAMNKLHGGREMGCRQDFTSSKSNM
jgi:hypothetical protein